MRESIYLVKIIAYQGRKSGGGAVYQDLGNLCFSFLSSYDPKLDFKNENNKSFLDSILAISSILVSKVVASNVRPHITEIVNLILENFL